jgi:hypothetical protein
MTFPFIGFRYASAVVLREGARMDNWDSAHQPNRGCKARERNERTLPTRDIGAGANGPAGTAGQTGESACHAYLLKDSNPIPVPA